MAIQDRIQRPLEGIRVLDLTHVLAGPYCTMLMADNGAEVIKIEPPGVGELGRKQITVAKDGRLVAHDEVFLHRNKKAIALNLRLEKGKDIFRRLVKVSDVVVENFTPQAMKRLGFGYDALKEINPRIVYTAISGFGHDDIYRGPYTDRPAFNPIAQAMSGMMDITGEGGGPPTLVGVPVGDLVPAIFALSGTLMALRMRDQTGVGQLVDVSMYDCLVSFNQRAVFKHYLTGGIPTRGNQGFGSPLGNFKVKEGYVTMTIMGDAMWHRFCLMIGKPGLETDERLTPDRVRGSKYESVIKPILEEWAKDKTRAEVVELFLANDLPAGPVQNAKDIYECPQVNARNMLVEFDDPIAGHLVETGNPFKFSGVAERLPNPAPDIGQDTDAVLQELLSLSDAELANLREEKVI